MYKEKLINNLIKHDLNKFKFGIFFKENKKGEKEYTYLLDCLASSPSINSNYEFVTKIGGDHKNNYTKEYIRKEIEESLDFWGLI